MTRTRKAGSGRISYRAQAEVPRQQYQYEAAAKNMERRNIALNGAGRRRW